MQLGPAYEKHRHIVKEQQKRFLPPFCPYENCDNHIGQNIRVFYVHRGWIATKRFPYLNKRYQCRKCRRTFCYTSFTLEYRCKRLGYLDDIEIISHIGASNRHISRLIGSSESFVRGRIMKLGIQALIQHARLTHNLKIEEPIVYDGAENFAGSQYDPNNINHAIGKESQFIYDFGFAPLNRKGKMSGRQKKRKEDIEKKLGKYPLDAIRKNTTEIFARLYEKVDNHLEVHSDKHFQYKRSVLIDLKSLNITLKTTSAKCYRNWSNPLFPVNHTDLLLRQNSAPFRRETIAFSKNHISMVYKYAIFMFWKNYLRPVFTKRHKRDPDCNKMSPAMKLGLIRKIPKPSELLNIRLTKRQVALSPEWNGFVSGYVGYPRQKAA